MERGARAKTGLTILSFNWYQGARHMLTKKAVATPADLKGVRVRTIGEPLWIKTINAMGATGTPLPWAEVYPALQTGVIDGAEAQPSAIWGAKLYEVVSHVTLTEHIFLMSGLIVSDKWLNPCRRISRKSSSRNPSAGAPPPLKANVDGAAKIFADIKSKGVTVTEPNKAPFRDAVKAVHQELGLTPMVAEVQAALKK